MNKTAPLKSIPFVELVALTAAVMALNAFAVDIMLPALGVIAEELKAPNENDRQLIIVVYVLGNGIAQLFFGPIVDRFGRKSVLIWSLAAYAAGSILCLAASSFSLLLAARAFQGVTTAASRVAVTAIVRDQYAGRRMAEVMSLAVTIFMAAPIIAPGLGQIILAFAPWRWTFGVLLVFSALLGAWVLARIPETMAPADRQLLRPGPIARGYLAFLTNRVSIGYTVASAFCFGGVFSYISSAEQVYLETFGIGAGFALAFAIVALSLAVATLLNARFVSRYGMRRLSHIAMCVYFATNVLHFILIATIGESLVLFLIMMSATFFTLGLIGPNATALAMEPMGHHAGAAAAANGFASTTISALLGGIVGAQYDGTTTPLVIGFALLGLASILTTLWTEKGRLFHPGEGYR